LNHSSTAFWAEFCPGGSHRPILRAARNLARSILSSFGSLLHIFHDVAQAKCTRQTFYGCAGLFTFCLSDLVLARTIFLAEPALGVEIRQTYDSAACWAFTEVNLDLFPGILQLGWRHLHTVAGVFPNHIISNRTSKQRYFTQESTGNLSTKILGHCAAHVWLATEFSIARIAIEYAIWTHSIISYIISWHS
jgi:hypothetical protein